jgi:subtilisin family serine protease
MRARPPIPILVVLLLVAASASAQGLGPEQRARALASGRMDPEVLDAVEASGPVRIVVAFTRAPGRSPRVQTDAVLTRLAGSDFRLARRYNHVHALAGFADAPALLRLLADPEVARVSLDAIATPQLAQSVPMVRLPVVQQSGLTGAGVSVAVVDTGVDTDHPDLIDAIVAQQCFCTDGDPDPFGCCPNGLDEQSGAGAAEDFFGHGTNVAGIVASAGVLTPPGGAPDAGIVAVRVFDPGPPVVAYGSDVVAALDWIRTSRPDVKVVNLSLAFGFYPGDCDDADANTMAIASAIDTLHQAGVVTIAAAGNNQQGTGMKAPACIANAVSVGAVWDEDLGPQSPLQGLCFEPTTRPDLVTCFSNSDATTDVFAPGAQLTAPAISGGVAGAAEGTSFAAPVVAACAAALWQGSPQASASEMAAALRTSPTRVEDTTNGLEFPRLDCREAQRVLVPGVPALPAGAPLRVGIAALLALLGTGALASRGRRRRPAGHERRAPGFPARRDGSER